MDQGNHHHHHHHHDAKNDETTMSMQHEGHHHHHHHGHHGDHMMMTMGFTLHTSGHFLFEGLRINTVYGIAIAMVAISVLTMFYEGCNSFVVSHMNVKGTKSSKQRQILRHLLLTLLKTFAVFIGYIIMLGIMTYNVWILISVILGSGVSHLLIRPIIYSHLHKHELHSDSARPEAEVLHDFPPDESENDTQEINGHPTVEKKLMEDYLSKDPKLVSYKTYDTSYT